MKEKESKVWEPITHISASSQWNHKVEFGVLWEPSNKWRNLKLHNQEPEKQSVQEDRLMLGLAKGKNSQLTLKQHYYIHVICTLFSGSSIFFNSCLWTKYQCTIERQRLKYQDKTFTSNEVFNLTQWARLKRFWW